MEGVNATIAALQHAANETIASAVAQRIYSPVALNVEWPSTARLIFMTILAGIGTLFNGFFIASFFIDATLRQIGYIYLASIGIADLIITAIVMPITAVVLMSGEEENVDVCHVQHFLGISATYCYSVFFLCLALENFVRVCSPRATYNAFLNCNIRRLITGIIVICFTTGAVGVYLRLDYDYCNREFRGNLKFRIITATIFHLLPSAMTFIFLISTIVGLQHLERMQGNKLSGQFTLEKSAAFLNVLAYCIYLAGWLPYIVVSFQTQDVSDSVFYNSVWLGIARSVLTSFLYSLLHHSFREAYNHMFSSCCIKSVAVSIETISESSESEEEEEEDEESDDKFKYPGHSVRTRVSARPTFRRHSEVIVV